MLAVERWREHSTNTAMQHTDKAVQQLLQRCCKLLCSAAATVHLPFAMHLLQRFQSDGNTTLVHSNNAGMLHLCSTGNTSTAPCTSYSSKVVSTVQHWCQLPCSTLDVMGALEKLLPYLLQRQYNHDTYSHDAVGTAVPQ
jgi:hypothetical protein